MPIAWLRDARADRPATGARLAVAGLVGTLVLLAAVTVVGSTVTRRVAHQAEVARDLSDIYGRAASAVTTEESLARQYRLEPGPQVLSRYLAAREEFTDAMRLVERHGADADRRLAAEVLGLHGEYNTRMQRLFEAVDAGAGAGEQIVLAGEVEPDLQLVGLRVRAADGTKARVADAALARVDRVASLVMSGIVAGFLLAILAILGFGRLVLRYQRRLVEQSDRNRHLARHDSLTGLANRSYFTELLAGALHGGGRAGQVVAVVLLDLDRFKEINDTLGHHVGDEVLRQVGPRLLPALGDDAVLARLGGDEFAVLLQVPHAQAALDVATRLVAQLHLSYRVDDITLDLEASAGVAVGAPAPAQVDTDTLLRQADLAMYEAKERTAGVVVFDPDRHVHGPNRPEMLTELRRAIETDGELELHFQPKIELATGSLAGLEALLRWHHPTKGLVGPADFIPVAEGTGLITALTDVVVDLALQQLRVWLDDGLAVPVAVNVSARCLVDAGLPDRVLEALARHGVPAGLLRLEVTESALMTDPTRAIGILGRLRDSGIRLSVDDFGTGYSSMVHLKQFTFDELKIDRSFVAGMTRDRNDAALVQAVIELGHAFGLTVVAEGVETAEHSAALTRLGCDVGQGYHYARPMPASGLLGWLAGSPAGLPAPSRSISTANGPQRSRPARTTA